MSLSVTVSIGELSSGIFRLDPLRQPRGDVDFRGHDVL